MTRFLRILVARESHLYRSKGLIKANHTLSFLIALASLAFAPVAQADLVVGYAAIDVFPEDDKFLAPINGVGVTASNLTTEGLVNRTGGGVNYVWSGFPTGGPSVADAYLFDYSSAFGYDLTSLDIYGVRSDDGPIDLELRIDTGSGFQIVSSVGVSDTASVASFDLSAYDNITGASFLLLGSNANNSGANATLSILGVSPFTGVDGADFVLNGVQSAAVPEASAFLYGGLIAAGLIGWKWRQNRRVEQALA
jgi:hypothetical protein